MLRGGNDIAINEEEERKSWKSNFVGMLFFSRASMGGCARDSIPAS
jgi:hypothetical protein